MRYLKKAFFEASNKTILKIIKSAAKNPGPKQKYLHHPDELRQGEVMLASVQTLPGGKAQPVAFNFSGY